MVPSIRTTSGTLAAASVLLRGTQHSAVSGSTTTIPSVRRTFHDNSSDNTRPQTQQQQRPNRLTTAYNEMQRQCPQAIADYAGCIQANADDLLKNTCHKEFDAVRECFRQARKTETNVSMADWNHP